ncbi:hypothetical protein ACET3Z_011737 [Daucus carota]
MLRYLSADSGEGGDETAGWLSNQSATDFPGDLTWELRVMNQTMHLPLSKNLDTSSSSLSHSPLPDSPVEHPHNTTTPSQTEVEGNDNLDSNLDTGYEHEIPTAESPASTPDDEMLLFTLDSGDDKENHEIYNAYVALSTLSPELTDSTLELGSNAPTTSPPTQVMERPSGSKYRIPSSVFARSMSNTPDWSCASNESLFSIRMGNMSFRTDDFWKSGEIGLKSAELEMIKNGDSFMLRSEELGFSSGADNSLRGGITVKSDRGSSPAPTQSTSQPKKEQEPKSPAAALQTAKTGWFSWMSCYWCRPYCCL